MAKRITLASGITLNTEIDGQKCGPWIILSNSLGANLQMWTPQIATLARKYRVLRYDTRGHGDSDSPLGPYSLEELTRDVVDLMDYHQIEQAAFMGLSLGGMTGLNLALNRHDRITRLVCANARADAPSFYKDMWIERIAIVRNAGLAGVVANSLKTWFTDAWLYHNPEESSRIREMILGNDAEGYIACCQAIRHLDLLPRLCELSIPVLYVVGDEDVVAPTSVMEKMASETLGSELIEIAAAAHISNLCQPAEFNAAISGFL
ncbi:MAG: alpha/beta fold hydrolase [Aestuariivita sp.]|nr:alpha/beta fold hydrolase [Aestuariivita sp.]MCY4345343.1 alpha/beta fold hydrolase [Aestuariivita sp.]